MYSLQQIKSQIEGREVEHVQKENEKTELMKTTRAVPSLSDSGFLFLNVFDVQASAFEKRD